MGEDSSDKSGSSAILTEIRIAIATTNHDIVSLTENVKQLNIRFVAYANNQDKLIREHADTLQLHSLEIYDLKNRVRSTEYWDKLWDRIGKLEEMEQRRYGSSKWSNIAIDIFKSVFVAIAIALTLFFMAGGRIPVT